LQFVPIEYLLAVSWHDQAPQYPSKTQGKLALAKATGKDDLASGFWLMSKAAFTVKVLPLPRSF